jgi:uncharacterized protein YndB with AHSA1/START domain
MTPDLGEITPCYTITFRRRSKHPAERLWRAITAPDEVSKWMDYPVKIDLRVGGDWYVDFTQTDDSELKGIIVRIEEGRVLAYAWGRTVCEWTVSDAEDGCTYAFVQNGLEPSDGETPEGYAAGWHGFLDQLDMHLEGKYLSHDESAALVRELMGPYSERVAAAKR